MESPLPYLITESINRAGVVSLQLRGLPSMALMYVSGFPALESAIGLRYSKRHRVLMYTPRIIFPMDNLVHVRVIPLMT